MLQGDRKEQAGPQFICSPFSLLYIYGDPLDLRDLLDTEYNLKIHLFKFLKSHTCLKIFLGGDLLDEAVIIWLPAVTTYAKNES